MSNNENQSLYLALYELRILLSQTLQAGDTLDQKINNTLSAAGLIIAITSTLQISLSPNASNLYWAVLIAAVAFYLTVVILGLLGMKPQTYRTAISADWDELDKQIFSKSENDALLVLLSGYVEQIAYNNKINRRKARFFVLDLIVLTAMVIALLSLIPISARGM